MVPHEINDAAKRDYENRDPHPIPGEMAPPAGVHLHSEYHGEGAGSVSNGKAVGLRAFPAVQ
jgi:hypothetical protein